MFHEARGHSISRQKSREEREKELHHLTVKAHPDGTPESPRWLVEHHPEEADAQAPETHEFRDGHEMLAHIAEHACVPESDEGEGY